MAHLKRKVLQGSYDRLPEWYTTDLQWLVQTMTLPDPKLRPEAR